VQDGGFQHGHDGAHGLDIHHGQLGLMVDQAGLIEGHL
jgi:hypothetical protein